MAEVTCTSRHRPGARWFKGEDRTLTCELRPGHLVLWHRRDGFEWDDDHAELESGPEIPMDEPMIDRILEVAGQLRPPWVRFCEYIPRTQVVVAESPMVKNRTLILHTSHRPLVEDAINEGIFRAELHPSLVGESQD